MSYHSEYIDGNGKLHYTTYYPNGIVSYGIDPYETEEKSKEKISKHNKHLMDLSDLIRDINKPCPISARDYRLVKKYYRNKSLAMLEGILETLTYQKNLSKFDKIRKEVIQKIIEERDSREF